MSFIFKNVIPIPYNESDKNFTRRLTVLRLTPGVEVEPDSLTMRTKRKPYCIAYAGNLDLIHFIVLSHQEYVIFYSYAMDPINTGSVQ